MIAPEVNFVLVIVATVANMVLGSVWYMPNVFGNIWMKLSGITHADIEKNKHKMPWMYLIAAAGGFVMAYVLAHFVFYVNALNFSDALQLGFWLWLGIVAPVLLGSVLWEGKPWKLFLINGAFYLVNLVLMASILTIWR